MSNSKKPTVEKVEVEFLDITGSAKNVMGTLQKVCKDLAKEPVTKQAAVGGISGWVVGYLSMKVGKAAATVVGGTLIFMQIAAHQGYIQVDWGKVNKDLEKNARKLKKEVEAKVGVDSGDSVAWMLRQNAALASSFAGGVLIGMASA